MSTPSHTTCTDDSYTVHGIKTPSLVAVTQIQHHILAMRAFRKLHHDLDDHGVRFCEETGRPLPTPYQHVYWAQAELRFEIWVNKVLHNRAKTTVPLPISELPPLDVLMILHAYMLDPWAYQEDCSLRYPQLNEIGPFPFESLNSLIDSNSFEYLPQNDQVCKWETRTGEPFVLSFEPPVNASISLSCPNAACGKLVQVQWMTGEHTGFGEPNFTIRCSNCRSLVKRPNLQCSQFAKDIKESEAGGIVLLGTLLNSKGIPDRSAAEIITRAIARALEDQLPFPAEWTLQDVSSALAEKEYHDDKVKLRIPWILRSYSKSIGFSRNLIEAVLFHAKFFESLQETKWFERDGNSRAILEDAVGRYHQFLDLVPTCFSPPLDIDLVWHTHQLSGAAYSKATIKVIGCLLAHDDEGVKDDLEELYKASENLWKEKYTSPFNGLDGCSRTTGSGDCGTGCLSGRWPPWDSWPFPPLPWPPRPRRPGQWPFPPGPFPPWPLQEPLDPSLNPGPMNPTGMDE